MKRIFTCFVFLLLPISLLGQVNLNDKEGVIETQEDGLSVVFDEFTGELQVGFLDTTQIEHSINGRPMLVMPLFIGNIEKTSFIEILFSEPSPQFWSLSFIAEPRLFFESIVNIDNNRDSLSVPFLVNNDRMTVDTYYISDSSEESSNDNWIFLLSESKWNQFASAKEVKFRIAGQVTKIPDSTLIQMTRVSDKLNELRDDVDAEEKEIEETEVPPKTEEVEDFQEGVRESGDERGVEGDVNIDQGTGTTEDASSPYQLQWEGDLDRTPQIQPLPSNPTIDEATITIRFEVKPDGSLGRVFPVQKMNPKLEREVMRTLRSWRFSRLPEDVPQEPQWGIITFRFVLD